MKQLENFWMPFSPNADFKENPRIITKAEGVYLWNEDGRKIIDASSGLFCVALGHCRSEITEAVTEQMQTLDYASPFNSAHNRSFEFAEKLAAKLPDDINSIFFANSGSEAVDTAIKLVTAYHRANGEPSRTHLVSRQRAYHGINIGGTSLSGITKNREAFCGVTLPVSFLSQTWTGKELFKKGLPETGAETAYELEKIVSIIGAKNISAVFVEPVAGSTGVLLPPKGYLKILREICDKYGILLVFDEVITAFYRTGKMFASETFDVVPDIITMAKALTNAAIPMGALACRQEIYDKIIEKGGGAIEFFHGYTYSGHPAACAAGIKTLELFEKDNVAKNVENLSPYFEEKMHDLKNLPNIKDIRVIGMLAGLEFHPEGNLGAFGMKATKKLYQAGLHAKFTGDTVTISPPLISKKEHIDEICDIFCSALG